MKYHVVFTKTADKKMQKLDRSIATTITKWIRKHLEGCENPRAHGKGLTSTMSGKWRYRVGDYRLIANIEDARVVILVLDVARRDEAYR